MKSNRIYRIVGIGAIAGASALAMVGCTGDCSGCAYSGLFCEIVRTNRDSSDASSCEDEVPQTVTLWAVSDTPQIFYVGSDDGDNFLITPNIFSMEVLSETTDVVSIQPSLMIRNSGSEEIYVLVAHSDFFAGIRGLHDGLLEQYPHHSWEFLRYGDSDALQDNQGVLHLVIDAYVEDYCEGYDDIDDCPELVVIEPGEEKNATPARYREVSEEALQY